MAVQIELRLLEALPPPSRLLGGMQLSVVVLAAVAPIDSKQIEQLIGVDRLRREWRRVAKAD